MCWGRGSNHESHDFTRRPEPHGGNHNARSTDDGTEGVGREGAKGARGLTTKETKYANGKGTLGRWEGHGDHGTTDASS